MKEAYVVFTSIILHASDNIPILLSFRVSVGRVCLCKMIPSDKDSDLSFLATALE